MSTAPLHRHIVAADGFTETTTVVVHSAVPIVASGVRELLHRADEIEVVSMTRSVEQLTRAVAELAPDTVVLYHVGAGGDDPRVLVEAAVSTARAAGRLVAIVCVIPSTASIAGDLARCGVSAVLTTDDGASRLAAAVSNAEPATTNRLRSWEAGRGYLARPTARSHRGVAGNSTLTPRELEVLRGMAEGLTTRAIAAKLDVSVNTVRTHVQNLMPKLGVHTRLRATAVALELGLIRRPAPARLHPAR